MGVRRGIRKKNRTDMLGKMRLLKNINEISERVHHVIQKQLSKGWCLASRATRETDFAFVDVDNNNGLGCLIGVVLGDEYDHSQTGEIRSVAARKLGITEENLISIEDGFEGRGRRVYRDRDEALYRLGQDIRETYNA